MFSNSPPNTKSHDIPFRRFLSPHAWCNDRILRSWLRQEERMLSFLTVHEDVTQCAGSRRVFVSEAFWSSWFNFCVLEVRGAAAWHLSARFLPAKWIPGGCLPQLAFAAQRKSRRLLMAYGFEYYGTVVLLDLQYSRLLMYRYCLPAVSS